jgi:hypothetical protein
MAIRVYVRRKGDFPEAERVPATIEGIPTDVIEADIRSDTRVKATTADLIDPDAKRYNPLVGGISIAPSRSDDTAGTLGLMVKDNATGKPMMLSNYHVMCLDDGEQDVGDDICQEARGDNSWGWCGDCAELTRWKAGNVSIMDVYYGIDAAVARQKARDTEIGKVVDIGIVTEYANPEVGMRVQKRGRTTLLTSGTISDIHMDVVKDFGPPIGQSIQRNQIYVTGDTEPFALGGDSGSVYVRTTEFGTFEVVGLHWGANGLKIGIGCWIGAVLAELGISVT